YSIKSGTPPNSRLYAKPESIARENSLPTPGCKSSNNRWPPHAGVVHRSNDSAQRERPTHGGPLHAQTIVRSICASPVGARDRCPLEDVGALGAHAPPADAPM